MKIKGIIYIAGSYRASSINGVLENILRARNAAKYWWQEGWAVLCPHTNTAFMDGVVPDEIFLEGDLVLLRKCDGIALLDGWWKSAGARQEAIVAVEIGLALTEEKIDPTNGRSTWMWIKAEDVMTKTGGNFQ